MEPPQLGKAAAIYEKLGRSCMEKKLLAMNAKGYWLQTGLCLLGECFSMGDEDEAVLPKQDYHGQNLSSSIVAR